MPISHIESAQLICSQCQAAFSADIWLILDAEEHPDQVAVLRQGGLNQVTCSVCGTRQPTNTPLIFHHSQQRRVVFAMPPGTAEYVWREQARDLHALLLGSIPIDERRPYLNDVQIAQDIAGIAHILKKAERRATNADRPLPGKPVTLPPSTAASAPARSTRPTPAPAAQAEAVQPDTGDLAQLQAALQAFGSAQGMAAMQQVIQQYPILRTSQASLALEQLADIATEQREYETAEHLHQVRMLLARLLSEAEPADAPPVPPVAAATPAVTDARPAPTERDLPPELYQQLLASESRADVVAVFTAHPLLREPWVDAALSQAVNEVLDAGDDQLAYALEQRRELLAELRSEADHLPTAPPSAEVPAAPAAPDHALDDAIEALLVAGTDDETATALIDYPILLTDTAERALWELASDARGEGDDELAQHAIECRAMLRKVRAAL